VFQTSLSSGIVAISDLIPIYLHIQKLSRRLYIYTHSLFLNYIINLMLESSYSSNRQHHLLLMENLISKQKLKVKGPIVNTNNRLNGIFKSFNPFNSKFSPGNRLVDLFSSCFLFSYSDRRSINLRKSHL